MLTLLATALAAAPGWSPLPPGDAAALTALGPALPDTRITGLAAPVGDPLAVELTAWAVRERRVRLVVFDFPVTDLEPVDRALAACATAEGPVLPPAVEGWDPAATAFLGWACAWNRANPEDPVRVAGAGPIPPWDARRLLERELLPVAEADPEAHLPGVRRCQGAAVDSSLAWAASLSGPTPPRPTLADDAACRAALDGVERQLAAGRALLEARGLVRRAERALRGLRTFELQQVAARLDGDPTSAAVEAAEATERGLREAAKGPAIDQRVWWWAPGSQVSKAHPTGVGARLARRGDYAAIGVLAAPPAGEPPPESGRWWRPAAGESDLELITRP